MRKKKEEDDLGKDVGVATLGTVSAGVLGTLGGSTILVGAGIIALSAGLAYGTFRAVKSIRNKRRQKDNPDPTSSSLA